jgi:murein tripeptide amidase MpaA
MLSNLAKWTAGVALLSATASADRYLTEVEEMIMQVKKDTDGKEHISWKESLTEKMQHSSEFTDKIKTELLIPRLGNHYSYHDTLVIIEQLRHEFPNYIKISSFGKTYEGRDIPLIRLQSGPKPTKERPAMLITGAHHAREAVSIQMPFYIIYKFLHGVLHKDQFYIDLLENVTLYFVPILNVDGVFDIE